MTAPVTDRQPCLVTAFDDVASPQALADLVALDRDEQGWRNRTTHLNVAGPVLGGQIAAHCLVAAADGADGYLPSALHILFASAPSRDRAWNLDCEHLRDGRRFAQRLVRLTQDGRFIAHASAIFQAEEGTPEVAIDHRPPMPRLPGPETLPTRADLRRTSDPDIFDRAMYEGHEFMDIRPVPDEIAQALPGHGMQSAYWLRMPHAAGLDQITQMALLTLASDFWYSLPLQAIGRRQGLTETPKTTSLDHCIWFHDRLDCGEWLLFQASAPVAAGGVGMKRAMIWQADGRLVANVEQRALARPVPPGAMGS